MLEYWNQWRAAHMSHVTFAKYNFHGNHKCLVGKKKDDDAKFEFNNISMPFEIRAQERSWLISHSSVMASSLP